MRTDTSPIPDSDSPPPLNTAYRELIKHRREELHTQLAQILPPRSTFTLEIGCGHGHFLNAYAEAHPDKQCIGIDIVGERVERALRKRDRARLKNLHFVRAEARLFLQALPEEVAFSDLFILFPDPWPKLRHQKHRIIQTEFLSAAAERATEHSHLFFRTDFSPYFEYTQRVLGQHPHWRIAPAKWPFEFCTVFQSRSASFDSLIARRIKATTPTIS